MQCTGLLPLERQALRDSNHRWAWCGTNAMCITMQGIKSNYCKLKGVMGASEQVALNLGCNLSLMRQESEEMNNMTCARLLPMKLLPMLCYIRTGWSANDAG